MLSLGSSAIAGTLGLRAYPFPADHAVLALIHVVRPALYTAFRYVYATMWFSSAFLLARIGVSCITIFVGRGARMTAAAPLAPYPEPERREDLFLVLGEQRRALSRPGLRFRSAACTPASSCRALPRFVVGAIGSGKTSACMYPYVEQLLAYRASDPARKAAGLVLEVKGDFCRQVRDILRRHSREADYVEVSLDSPYRYNPLHNDLDAYALAYGIATLMTNLFGRGKEPVLAVGEHQSGEVRDPAASDAG